jgi:hypothetical protein
VDYLIITGLCKEVVKELKEEMKAKFPMSDLGFLPFNATVTSRRS